MSDAKDQAKAQYESICAMLAAVDVDYNRLDELRELIQGEGCEDQCDEYKVELEELKTDAGDYEDQGEALQSIYEDPLSVQVRSGWVNPGEDMEASEFEILLCTGGPAVRIRGELDENGCPDRAWMEHQDWGTPWERYYEVDQSTLLQYAQYFFN